MYKRIVAMSYDREKVKDKLLDAGDQIVMHMMKILCYPDSRDYEHWKQEIYGFLFKVPKLKGNNRWPSKKFIFESISAWNDTLDSQINLIVDDYGQPQSDISVDNLCKAIEEYEDFLSSTLSERGVAYRNECYSKLDELVNKYAKTERQIK